jgi:ABC-2 type transport system permease protein
MRRIWVIALNDLRASLRDRGTWINVFVLPIFMTILLATVSQSSSDGGRIDVLALDPADASTANFVGVLQRELGSTFTLCDLRQPAQAPNSCDLKAASGDLRALTETRVKTNKVSAALVIPADFGARVQAGQTATLEYITPDGQQQNAAAQLQQKVEAALTRLNGAIVVARGAVRALGNPADTATYDKVYAAAEAIWASDPVKIVQQTNTGGDVPAGTGFGQSAPGFGAMFVLINAIGLAVLFVEERTTWTMQRMMMMPLARWQILAGKLLGRYLLSLFVFGMLIGVGLAFGTRFGDPLGVIVTVLAYCLAATGIALAFSTLVRTRSQAANLGFVVAMLLAPLGGAWWPLSIVPEFMRTIGHISPIAWSQNAFNQLVYYNGTLLDILPYIGVLLLFAAVCFAFGLRRFRYI